jgi:WhiB family transcriptional regulator, redox-sensing transcriptional regulator
MRSNGVEKQIHYGDKGTACRSFKVTSCRRVRLMALADLEWQVDAVCRDMPLDFFFPEERIPPEEQVAAVREVCADCPVRRQCLTFALTNPSLLGDGIWAGFSVAQRNSLRRTVCSGCRLHADPVALWLISGTWRATGTCSACDRLRARGRAATNAAYLAKHPPPEIDLRAVETSRSWWERQLMSTREVS